MDVHGAAPNTSPGSGLAAVPDRVLMLCKKNYIVICSIGKRWFDLNDVIHGGVR